MKNCDSSHFPSGKWKKTLFFMRLNFVVLLCSVGTLVASPTYSQQTKLDVSYERTSLISVLNDLQAKTGYYFVYFDGVVPGDVSVTVSLKNASLEDILEEVLTRNGFTYKVGDSVIGIGKAQAAAVQQPSQVTITGTVRDAGGSPIAGATVLIKGTQTGAATDPSGAFSIRTPFRQDIVLTVSFLGKKSAEVAYTGQQSITITLEDDAAEIDEVVVTGMFERRKESFTGASATFSKDELRRVGNSNVLQSIKNLDPSFRFEENLADGSNPNATPEIRLRGQSGFPDLNEAYTSDPNAPYFIVDGFESSLTAVLDMDMNRIESVTILKDAAAKAIYGSKAANGVVVIETLRPQAGALRVTYSGSVNVQIPDLSSYDLTNAAEKLAVEQAAGHFNYIFDNGVYQATNAANQYLRNISYNALLDEVMRGVDTDWLAQPTRVGVGQKHSLFVEGGDQAFQYGIDLSYNNVAGVMKGSNRDTFAGGIKLSYRYKSLSFRNNLTLTYNKGTNSPYGDFSDYAKMNPYLRMKDADGDMLAFPGDYIPGYVQLDSQDGLANPLYNSQFNSKDYSQYTSINNNFYIEWTPFEGFKTTGRLSFTTDDTGSEVFIPAKNTAYIDYTSDEDLKRKGRYTVSDGKATTITADINAQYSRVFAERHMLFANVGWTLSDNRYNSHGLIAEGFPDNDKLDNLAFASQYAHNTTPTSSESTTRSIGVVGVLNYSYADRYLFDASIRMSGSSQFGSDNRWGTFWSFGAGWNVHNERFMEDVDWLQAFKLRGSLGYTGSQDFAPYQSKATFQYYTDKYYNGQGGAYLMAMANPDLKWQRKLDQNIGLDLGFLENRLSARFDYYVSNTDDLLTSVTIPSSTGFRSYIANLGEVKNTGLEFNVRYQVWRNPERQAFLNVFVMGAHNKSKIMEISEALKEYNDTQVAEATNGYIRRYVEGQSLNGIWAVPSAGIDPTTGSEVFIRQDGTRTFEWDSDDLRACGDTEPKLNGSVGFNFDYKGFSLNVIGTWRFGGQIYNQTLVNKVENADLHLNVDRRIFTDRWMKPGDNARFKAMTDDTKTKATSRFVEDDDLFMISSVNASYDLHNLGFVKRSGIERLRLIFDMADIGRLSSVKIERGTSYPFAYSFSFTLQATF